MESFDKAEFVSVCMETTEKVVRVIAENAGNPDILRETVLALDEAAKEFAILAEALLTPSSELQDKPKLRKGRK